jgi:CubicO group peptidase (beta-lactamase class C family)
LWGGAFNTAYMVDPTRKLITVFFFQRTPFALSSILSSLEKATIKILDKK